MAAAAWMDGPASLARVAAASASRVRPSGNGGEGEGEGDAGCIGSRCRSRIIAAG